MKASLAIVIAATTFFVGAVANADESWQGRAQAAVAADTQQWMLVVVIPHQQHVDIHGYATDDDCTKAGMTMTTKAEALPWFCVVDPRQWSDEQ